MDTRANPTPATTRADERNVLQRELGQRGGHACLAKHGREHYVRIGRAWRESEANKAQLRANARKGGMARARKLREQNDATEPVHTGLFTAE